MTSHDKLSKGSPPLTSDTPTANNVASANQADATAQGYEIEFGVDKPRGSMELGKQRNREDGVATEPEKHLTPRATSKEFFFPKSN